MELSGGIGPPTTRAQRSSDTMCLPSSPSPSPRTIFPCAAGVRDNADSRVIPFSGETDTLRVSSVPEIAPTHMNHRVSCVFW